MQNFTPKFINKLNKNLLKKRKEKNKQTQRSPLQALKPLKRPSTWSPNALPKSL
jgi:hypothetical protein